MWRAAMKAAAKEREGGTPQETEPQPTTEPQPADSHVSDGEDDEARLGFEHTLMYGRYSKDLGAFAKDESKRLKEIEKQRKQDEKQRRQELHRYRGKWSRRVTRVLGVVWKHTFARVGEDWVFLAVLGILMALISFVMDYGIGMCNRARIWLYRDLTTHPLLQYLAWVTLPTALILFSAGFVHIVSKSAVGSGIPEMKTILRGVPLDEYLTLRTLVAKVIGLTACLGSGMPLGKEGPFVHIASIVATLLTRLITSFKGIYENESRNSEMLAAACAVGVACSFAAPIGGVLFSIEVTSVYFAVRNYWRGFFAAVCGAMVFRLMSVWFQDEETITALFKTDFKVDFPFDPQELFVFALIGAVAGLAGAFYVWVHRKYVVFMRNNVCMKSFLRQNRFLYPFFVALMVSSITFPLGVGQFLAADQTTHDQVLELFANFTWSSPDLAVDEAGVVAHWTNPYTNFYVNLVVFMAVTMCTAVVASTLPVPAGTFIPVFKMGAAFGRLVGECMAIWFPSGVRYGGHLSPIMPGGYAIVGAAAMAGSVTNTISTSVIVFELTGQITHILPVMIAVLIANAISQLLQPSIYDSIIQIKKLPYLPDIVTSTNAYSVYVEDIMVRDVKYIWHGITYRQLRDVLRQTKKLSSVPLVDAHDNMILLGSIRRKQLIVLLETHLGRDRRIEVVAKWQRAAQKIRLAQHNHNWKALVALARGEQEDAAREETAAAITQSLAVNSDEASQPESDDDDDDFMGVSGAQVSRRRPSDGGDGGSEIPLVDITARRPSRFAVTPVTIEGAPAATVSTQDEVAASKATTAKAAASPGHPLTSQTPTAATSAAAASPTGSPSSKTTFEDIGTSPSKSMPASAFAAERTGEVDSEDSAPEQPGTAEQDPLINGTNGAATIAETDESEDEKSASTSNVSSRRPLKPILKKTGSFTFRRSTPKPSPLTSHYATVGSGGDGRLRSAFERVLKRSREERRATVGSPPEPGKAPSLAQKHVTLPTVRVMDMSYEDQKKWEEEELEKEVSFDTCKIDPAPFQLVERTSLLKMHSLFSMLGLNHAYVTAIGRLIGVVALKELRVAIQRANHFTPEVEPTPAAAEKPDSLENGLPPRRDSLSGPSPRRGSLSGQQTSLRLSGRGNRGQDSGGDSAPQSDTKV